MSVQPYCIMHSIKHMLIFVTLVALLHTTVGKPDSNPGGRRRNGRRRGKSDKPNIVVVITDDQDLLLGSMDYMPKTLRLLRDAGATMKNAFVSTPMCCPSRSSFLTGMYAHNHHVYTNNDNCSSVYWQMTHERKNFATYLSNAGYRTGYFGKYLNEYNGTYTPPGWREWLGLIRNSRFYNYSVNFNNRILKHRDNYYEDYLTDLIANDSVTFLKLSKQYYPKKPVLMVLSPPAPHGPEDAAPQYQHLFENVTTHRTASWNYAPNPDKQWILQHTGKMEPIHIAFTDMLHRKRLQTLQSVDDAVEKVIQELRDLGELDNTYFLYTSDHGYHLGQYGLLKGKAMPYEFDIRVPFYIRGPGIRPGSSVDHIINIVDIAPTILDMAGVPTPEQMDGMSFLKLVNNKKQEKIVWKDSILVERGKITLKKIKSRDMQEAAKNNIVFLTKDTRLNVDCSKPDYQVPCKPGQKWYCLTDMETGKLRMGKCRKKKTSGCICPQKTQPVLNKAEKRNQKKFIQTHVKIPHTYKPRFIRNKRSSYLEDVNSQLVQYEGKLHRIRNKRSFDTDYDDPFTFPLSIEEYNYVKRCRVLQNDTIVCTKQVYQNVDSWKRHKQALDKLIEHYKKQIDKLKEIRKFLKSGKPVDPSSTSSDVIMRPTTDSTLNRQDVPRNRALIEETTNILSGDGEICRCSSPLKSDSIRKNHYRRRQQFRKPRNRLDYSSRHGYYRDGTRRYSGDDPSAYKKAYNQQRRSKKKKSAKRMERKLRRIEKKRRKGDCNKNYMNCFTQDNQHWKSPPLWNLGPFCFCPNANNNTYWCVRTINKTANFLYCEFITGFISYYDMLTDPHQLRNAVHDLDYGVLQQLHETLNSLRACQGSQQCFVRYKPRYKPSKNDRGADLKRKTKKVRGGQNR